MSFFKAQNIRNRAFVRFIRLFRARVRMDSVEKNPQTLNTSSWAWSSQKSRCCSAVKPNRESIRVLNAKTCAFLCETSIVHTYNTVQHTLSAWEKKSLREQKLHLASSSQLSVTRGSLSLSLSTFAFWKNRRKVDATLVVVQDIHSLYSVQPHGVTWKKAN